MRKTKVLGKSLGEIEVLLYIKTLYTGEVLSGYRHPVVKKELDIYLPDLNIGFEYNGAYWHSTKFHGKEYHLEKQTAFKKAGIQVYFLDSADWEDSGKRSILEARITYILGQVKQSIYARKTEVVYPSVKEEKDFLTKNHIQGYAISSYRIGLSYQGELVGLLTFVKPRRTTNSLQEGDVTKLELLRYSTRIDSNLIGGFSRLLKNSIKDIKELFPQVKQILTYSDNSLSVGNLYEQTGFTYIRTSEPSYYYVLNGKKYNRYSFRKSVLKERFPAYYKENLTEAAIADSIPNLHRVWNVGNAVYTLDLNSDLQVKQTKETSRPPRLSQEEYVDNLRKMTGLQLGEDSTLDSEIENPRGETTTVREYLLSEYVSQSSLGSADTLFQRWLDEKFGKGVYELLGTFISFNHPVLIYDRENKIKKKILPKSLSTNGRFKVTDIFEKLEERYQGRFQPIMETFVNQDTPMEFRDAKYEGEIFSVVPRALYRRKTERGAPTKLGSFKERVQDLFGDEYIVLSESLENLDSLVEIYSKKLDETRTMKAHDFLSNRGFRQSKISKGERLFDERLLEHGFERIDEFRGLRGKTKVRHKGIRD